MELKNYSELAPTSCVCLIVREVVNEGVSYGWSGKNSDLPCLQQLLDKINVKCMSDSQGFYYFKR